MWLLADDMVLYFFALMSYVAVSLPQPGLPSCDLHGPVNWFIATKGVTGGLSSSYWRKGHLIITLFNPKPSEGGRSNDPINTHTAYKWIQDMREWWEGQNWALAAVETGDSVKGGGGPSLWLTWNQKYWFCWLFGVSVMGGINLSTSFNAFHFESVSRIRKKKYSELHFWYKLLFWWNDIL